MNDNRLANGTDINRKWLELITIALVGFFSPAGSAIVAGLAYFQQYYSGIDRIWIQMLLIGPTIISIPADLLAGKLCARYGHKRIVIIGLIMSTAAGFAPFFIRSYIPVLISRLVLGVGRGLAGSAVTGLIYCAYEDSETKARANVLLHAAGCVGSLVFTIMGGWLSDIKWFYCYLTALMGVPVILMSLFFTPPVRIKMRKHIPLFVPVSGKVWIYMLLLAVESGFAALFSNNLSGYTMSSGLGGALTAGTIGGILHVTGFLGCLLGYALYIKTGRWILAVCAGVMGIGYFILSGTSVLPIVFAAVAVFGFAETVKAPLTSIIISEMHPAETMTSVCGLSAVVEGIVSPVVTLSFTKIFATGQEGNERIQFFTAGICLLILAGLFLLYALKYKRPKLEDMPL